MNKTQLNERINQFWHDNVRVNGSEEDGAAQIDNNLKALIREVVGEITPERRESSGYITPFEDDFFNIAVDQMEAKAKELLDVR